MKIISLLVLIFISINLSSQNDSCLTKIDSLSFKTPLVHISSTIKIMPDSAGMAKILSIKKIKAEKFANKMEWLKIIGLYSASIILNGIGDGLNNSEQKTMGHVFNGLSIGVLLASPFLVNYNKKNWFWYALTYTSLRVGLFDTTYNLTRKLPLDFVGSTSPTDKIYKTVGVNPAFVKTNFLALGITFPLSFL